MQKKLTYQKNLTYNRKEYRGIGKDLLFLPRNEHRLYSKEKENEENLYTHRPAFDADAFSRRLRQYGFRSGLIRFVGAFC